MVFQHKLFGFAFFLLLNLSFCHGRNVTVEVIGLIHCTDCSSEGPLGLNIFIHCTSKNRESKTNGTVDREGKFNVTLFTELTKDGKNTIAECQAKLQNATSTAKCPLKSPQFASLKLFISVRTATQSAHNNISTLIQFSQVTCQSSAFFYWPTLPPSPGPTTGTVLPPPLSFPPAEGLIPTPAPAPTPAYLPPIPSLAPVNSPPFFKQPFYQTPSASPIPAPPVGILTPPTYRKPNPIPRAPPVPQLPPIPTVPRKYFNAPKSESQPPHPTYP